MEAIDEHKQQAHGLIDEGDLFMVAAAKWRDDGEPQILIAEVDGVPFPTYGKEAQIAHISNGTEDQMAQMMIMILDTHPKIRLAMMAIELDRGGPPHTDEDDPGDLV